MTSPTVDQPKLAWKYRVTLFVHRHTKRFGEFLHRHRLGTVKWFVVLFALLTVVNGSLALQSLLNDHTPYVSLIATAFSIYWGWDAYDDYKLLLEIEELEEETRLLYTLIQSLNERQQA